MLSLLLLSSLLQKGCISSTLLMQKYILVTFGTQLEVHIENGVKIVLKKNKQKTLPPPPQNPPVAKLRLFRK